MSRREGGISKDKGDIWEVEKHDGNTEWQVAVLWWKKYPFSIHFLVNIIPMICLPDHSIESISLACFIP